MSHDVIMTRSVIVDEAEASKLHYVLKLVDAVDRANDEVQAARRDMLEQDGLQALMEFDWGNLVRHCLPQIHLVFLRDKTRFVEEQAFVKFPWAFIVVRTAQLVKFDEVFELTLEEREPTSVPDAKDVREALRVLERAASGKEGIAAMDVTQLVRRLGKALALK